MFHYGVYLRVKQTVGYFRIVVNKTQVSCQHVERMETIRFHLALMVIYLTKTFSQRQHQLKNNNK